VGKEVSEGGKRPAAAKAAAPPPLPQPGLLWRTSRGVAAVPGALWRGFYGFWTPLRSVATGILLLIAVTIGWTVQQSLLSRAVKTLQDHADSGLAAVEREEWVDARQKLELTVAALDRLGRTDPEAQNLRQYYWETRALTRLCTAPIEELIETARRDLQQRDAKDKSRNNLATRFRGEWLVFQGPVRTVAEEEQPPARQGRELPVPWSLDNGAVRIRADFPAFADLNSGPGQPAIFAGSIADCERAEDGSWIVRLDPRTGFLWTHLETFRPLGFDLNTPAQGDAVKKLLDQQALAVGVEP
jgi:hypothetical protein